ncbi:MAG: hypothetical protein Q9M50_04935 [Methylococcales bacterium]|nr:hypothetical protein [Methylococcales bacterium]
MAYNKFTVQKVIKTFNLDLIDNEVLFKDVKHIEPSPFLIELMEKYLPLAHAIGTEKARSEFIIAPLLAELTEITNHSISLFSGINFTVDKQHGLSGRCDFLISASPIQYSLTAPVLALVEAKNDNINSGLGQCMAEMVAAQIFNQQENVERTIYGIVSTGSIWHFLKLEKNKIYIDKKTYFIDSIDLLLGVLSKTVS